MKDLFQIILFSIKKIHESFYLLINLIILVLKSKNNFYISSVSSLSSQLSLIIAFREYLKENKSNNKSKFLLILHFNNQIDPHCKYQIDYKKFGSIIKKEKNLKIFVINLDNKINRFIFLIYLQIEFIFKRLLNKKVIILIQTRPGWFEDRFTRFPFKSFLRFDKFILVGDGLLSLELYEKPFWLDKKDKANSAPEFNKYYRIYFLYNINIKNNKYLNNNNFKRIEPSLVRKSIRLFNNHNLISISKEVKIYLKDFLLNKNEIFLYAGTTFYETKRSSLESEIDLYLEYIKSLSIIKEFSNIFFKPHPSSHENKINSILKNLDSKYQNNQSIKILKEIANIPLEILVDLLLNFNNKLKIYLPICSSGSFATLLLYPKHIYPLKAFGKILIEKYIYKEYINSRLIQEKSIRKNMKQLGLNFIN